MWRLAAATNFIDAIFHKSQTPNAITNLLPASNILLALGGRGGQAAVRHQGAWAVIWTRTSHLREPISPCNNLASALTQSGSDGDRGDGGGDGTMAVVGMVMELNKHLPEQRCNRISAGSSATVRRCYHRQC